MNKTSLLTILTIVLYFPYSSIQITTYKVFICSGKEIQKEKSKTQSKTVWKKTLNILLRIAWTSSAM